VLNVTDIRMMLVDLKCGVTPFSYNTLLQGAKPRVKRAATVGAARSSAATSLSDSSKKISKAKANESDSDSSSDSSSSDSSDSSDSDSDSDSDSSSSSDSSDDSDSDSDSDSSSSDDTSDEEESSTHAPKKPSKSTVKQIAKMKAKATKSTNPFDTGTSGDGSNPSTPKNQNESKTPDTPTMARANTTPAGGAGATVIAKPNELLMQLDVLKYMHKGTPFLKYGKRGYPHFRQFQLSSDNMRLVWYSKQKKMKTTQVHLSDVDDIRTGQTTPNFERHRAPELARSSFSLIYRNRRETLDLIAKDPNEFKLWIQGA
jgi:hypothetical protein